MKHSIQSIVYSEASLKHRPKPSNSIGSAPCPNKATITNAAIKAKGSPIIAKKLFTTRFRQNRIEAVEPSGGNQSGCRTYGAQRDAEIDYLPPSVHGVTPCM